MHEDAPVTRATRFSFIPPMMHQDCGYTRSMRNPTFDPGLTQRYDGPLRRIINADGTFNVQKQGTNWRDVHPYLHLVSVSWTAFFGWILAAYAVVNFVFAAVYYALGPNALQ